MFGTTQLFVLCNPKERDSSKQKWPEVTYETAQEEIARCSGFDMDTENKSQGRHMFCSCLRQVPGA